MHRSLAIFGLLVAFAGPTAVAAETELITGSSYEIRVSAAASDSVENSMPRNGAYARGIALDLKGRWNDSRSAYAEAVREFSKMARTHPGQRKRVKLWQQKASFQRDMSRRLRIYRSRYSSASRLYSTASARHEKWLALRAFSAHDARSLRRKAIAEYRGSIKRGSSYYTIRARLGLATLLHQTGRHNEARRVFRSIRQPFRRWTQILEAAYYTAAGQHGRAISLAEKAGQSSWSNRRILKVSNQFDPLRGDRRFRRLMSRW